MVDGSNHFYVKKEKKKKEEEKKPESGQKFSIHFEGTCQSLTASYQVNGSERKCT